MGKATPKELNIGNFKDGFPNGNGIYYYNDTMYHSGDFQDGLKEGKGETHYLHKGMPDSVIKGYWSGDVFRGKKYVTYSFSTTGLFDLTEITPSNHSGSTVAIKLGTTSGTPNGAGSGVVLSLVSLVSPNGCILKMRSKMESSFKSYVTVELVSSHANYLAPSIATRPLSWNCIRQPTGKFVCFRIPSFSTFVLLTL